MEEQITQIAAPDDMSDAAMEEHRAALAKMRTAYALEQLYAASGAKDAEVLSRLIDLGQDDITIGEDGVPDVSAVKEKIEALRRDKAYLFADTDGVGVSAKTGAVGNEGGLRGTSAPRLGVISQTDASQMDDASYYRALFGRKRAGR